MLVFCNIEQDPIYGKMIVFCCPNCGKVNRMQINNPSFNDCCEHVVSIRFVAEVEPMDNHTVLDGVDLRMVTLNSDNSEDKTDRFSLN